MSQGTEPQLSQGSLAPPVEITGPATPVQRASLSASPALSIIAASHTSQSDKNKFASPPPLSSSDMTPPPSSQVPGAPLRRSRSQSSSLLASPPDIEKTLCVAYGASENLPTADEIDTANESRLRAIAKDLLGVAQEARMSALHFKLQHSLLSFASSEAVKRAEVEHQLARREVEILQSSEYRNRVRPSEPKSVQPTLNSELEAALKHSQELERINALLDRRLRRAKKLIEEEREKFELLAEENALLKKRIRDNRQHISRMFDQGSMSPSSQPEFQTPQRRSILRFPDSAYSHMSRPSDNHDPFAALLAADKVLNRESRDDRHRMPRHSNSGHIRGTHSLSSLPMTPDRSRTAHPDNQYLTPINKSRHDHHSELSESRRNLEERDRHDRDSTISASDAEEAVTDEDVPASQASSLATNMLRRNPMYSHREPHAAVNVPKSSTLLQTKIFGQVRKAGVEPSPGHLKRKASSEEDGVAVKKSKAVDGVGLGIEAYDTTRA